MAEKYFCTLNGYIIKDREAHEKINEINIRDVVIDKTDGSVTIMFLDKNGNLQEQSIKDGVVGSRWYCFPGILDEQGFLTSTNGSTINAKVNDMYLHPETGNVYQCNIGGTWNEAKWEYKCTIKGSSDSGGTNFTTDKTLTLKDGILSVNTVDKLNDETADNTLPITAAAVNVTVGNIEVLLQTI